jgi:hypothetical protein
MGGGSCFHRIFVDEAIADVDPSLWVVLEEGSGLRKGESR